MYHMSANKRNTGIKKKQATHNTLSIIQMQEHKMDASYTIMNYLLS